LFAQPLFSLPRQFGVWHGFERQIRTGARIEIPTIPVTQETGSQKSVLFILSQLNKAIAGLFKLVTKTKN
jgi:urease beta subunit